MATNFINPCPISHSLLPRYRGRCASRQSLAPETPFRFRQSEWRSGSLGRTFRWCPRSHRRLWNALGALEALSEHRFADVELVRCLKIERRATTCYSYTRAGIRDGFVRFQPTTVTAKASFWLSRLRHTKRLTLRLSLELFSANPVYSTQLEVVPHLFCDLNKLQHRDIVFVVARHSEMMTPLLLITQFTK
jgi:hypothetical protein